MAGPTVAERVGQVERSIDGLKWWIKGASVGLAIVLVVVGWWFHSEFMPAFHQLQTDMSTFNGRISNLEGEFSVLKLHSEATLPVEDFGRTLAQLHSALATAKREKKDVPANVLNGIQQRLLMTDHSLADFWPSIAQFITYRSVAFSSRVPTNLPDCTDSDPKLGRVTEVKGLTFKYTSSEYENCQLTLDSPKDTERLNSLIATKDRFLTFKHC